MGTTERESYTFECNFVREIYWNVKNSFTKTTLMLFYFQPEFHADRSVEQSSRKFNPCNSRLIKACKSETIKNDLSHRAIIPLNKNFSLTTRENTV